jgi:GT2 family glycosyltransferase
MRPATTAGEIVDHRAQDSDTVNVAVIIPVYNGGAQFRKCLESIANAQPKPSMLVVVADGDSDASWRVAEEFGARIVRRGKAGGPAVARNCGARSVRKDDILFFVDADVTIQQDTIRQVANLFQHYPSAAGIIGSYDDKPVQQNFLSQYKNLLHHYIHQTAQEEASTFWGACGAIRADVFHAMGGFDESYRRPSIEDVEFGYRLKQRGHQIRLCKTLQVTHLKRWKFNSLLRADIFCRALPWTELIYRHGKCMNDLNLKFSARLSVVLTYGAVITALASLWSPQFLSVAVLCSLALLLLNVPVYHFFHAKRGAWFAIRVVPWHVFYYFYSGFAFLVGTSRYWLASAFQRQRCAATQPLPTPLPVEAFTTATVQGERPK